MIAFVVWNLATALIVNLRIDDDGREPPRARELTIFVTGKLGSGKTSLIYGFLGEGGEVVKEKRRTSAVTLLKDTIIRNGVNVTLLERKSLEHDESEVDKDEVSLIQNVDLVLYSLRMDETRCRPGHKIGLIKLGSRFGSNIWNKTIIALTFANRVDFVDQEGKTESDKALLEDKKKHWTQCVHEVLIEEKIPETIMESIPMVPVGYYNKHILFDESWIDALYTSMLSRLTDDHSRMNLQLFLKNSTEAIVI